MARRTRMARGKASSGWSAACLALPPERRVGTQEALFSWHRPADATSRTSLPRVIGAVATGGNRFEPGLQLRAHRGGAGGFLLCQVVGLFRVSG